MRQSELFDVENRLQTLSDFGDPLKSSLVWWISSHLEKRSMALSHSVISRKGGRPPWDCVVMFKILILQTLYNISDEQLEFQIKDRLSFQRFLGLSLSDKVPDAKTIWLWRERFKKHKLMDKIFRKFDQELKDKGYLAMSGQIIDASIVPAPRQQNTRAEKDCIREGKTPEHWKENPHKLAQKDFDARWVMKYKKAKRRAGEKAMDIAIPQFGYKNHINVDKRHKFIRAYDATPASPHDSQHFEAVFD